MSAAGTVLQLIRDVHDFPEPGIVFKDITPLLADPDALDVALHAMSEPWLDDEIDVVIGLEARGFIFGAPVARQLGCGFVPVRKSGKLPHTTTAIDYGLEYGTDTLEIHTDALADGLRALVVDDVLATGGTAAAAAALVERAGGIVAGFSFLLELGFLDGRARLGGHRIETVITFEGAG